MRNVPFMAVTYCFLDLSQSPSVRVLSETGEAGPSGAAALQAKVAIGPRAMDSLTPENETLYLTHSESLEALASALERLAAAVRREASHRMIELGDMPEEVAA